MAFQAGWDEWGRGYREGPAGRPRRPSSLPDLPPPELVIVPADSRARRPDRAARDRRAGRGPGVPEDDVDSHFIRFLAIYRALKDARPGRRRCGPSAGRQPDDRRRTRAASRRPRHPDHDHPPRGAAVGAPVQRALPQAAGEPLPRFRAHQRPDRPDRADPAGLADPPQPSPRCTTSAPSPACWSGCRSGRLPGRAAGRAAVPDAVHAGPAVGRGRPMAGAPGPAGRRRPAGRPAARGVGPDGDGRDYLLALAQWDQIERRQVERLIAAGRRPAPVPVGGPMP